MGCAPSKKGGAGNGKGKEGDNGSKAAKENKKQKAPPPPEADDSIAMFDHDTEGQRTDREEDAKVLTEAQRLARSAPKPVNAKTIAKWNALLHGDLTVDVAAHKKIIRVFTSSTFTDTKIERNALMADVYPFLRQVCQTLGYQFEVVDMRWGVREDTGDSHGTSELCMSEIAKCLRNSAGPAFVTFLCNKYGYRPFPSKIPQTDFDKMHAYLLGKNAPGVDLLKEWFLLDENIVPPTYILQRISSKIPDYICKDRDRRKVASGQWWAIFEQLQALFFDAAKTCLPEATSLPYLVSVTHEEVINGIIENVNRAKQSFCFRRYLNGVEEKPGDHKAGNFVDVKDGKIDEDAVNWLHKLKDQIPTLLKPDRIVDSTIAWTDGGPQTDNPEFVAHVRRLCNDFAAKIAKGILDAYKRDNIEEDPLVLEVRSHQMFMRERFTGAQLRGTIHNTIIGYVQGIFEAQEKQKPSLFAKLAKTEAAILPINRPLVITGKPGSGKTTTLALAAQRAKKLVLDRAVVLVRACGTTTDSTHARSLMYSLCEQLERAYATPPAGEGGRLEAGKELAGDAKAKVTGGVSAVTGGVSAVTDKIPGGGGGDDDVVDDDDEEDFDMPSGGIPEDYDALKHHFKELLETLPNKNRPCFIFLDALNQLSDLDQGRDLGWLPMELPQFVGLVVTTDPVAGGCLSAIRDELPVKDFGEQYLEVPPLDPSEFKGVLKKMEEVHNRKLTEYQSQLLLDAFEACPLPLYAKLCFENALLWSSYTPTADISIAPDIQSAITRLFDRLEAFHGYTLFSRALGYITLSKNGLNVTELEDILSCDDKVLDDVFEWWVPPTRRLPPLLWIRIRNDLKNYLAERGADGVQVYTWYHDQFHETALERYCKEEDRKSMHTIMAGYFHGEWADNGIPYKDKDGHDILQDRQLKYMPLWHGDSPNVRKVEELPYHQIRAGLLAQAFEHCLGNLEFIEAKSQYPGGVASLAEDYRVAVVQASATGAGELTDHIKGFQRFFVSCSHLLAVDSSRVWQLAFNTPDRSLPYKAALECVEKGESDKVAMCMGWEHKSQADDPCLKTFTNLSSPFLSPDAKLLGAIEQSRNIIQLYDIESSQMVAKYKVSSEKEVYAFWKKDNKVTCPVFSNDGKEVAFVTSGDTINIWSIEDKSEYAASKDVAKVKEIKWIKWSPDNTELLVCDVKGNLRCIMLKRPGIENPNIPAKKQGMLSGLMGKKDDGDEEETQIVGHLRKWDKFTKHADENGCADAAFHPNGIYIVSAGYNDDVWVWRIETGYPEPKMFNMAKFWLSRLGRAKKKMGFAPFKREPRGVGFSPDGQSFLYASPLATLKFDTDLLDNMSSVTKAHMVRMKGLKDFGTFSPDSTAVVGGGRPFKVCLPDKLIAISDELPEEKKAKKKFAITEAHLEPFSNYHRGRVRSAVWTGDGKQIVSRDETSVKLWDVDDAIKAFAQDIVTPAHPDIMGACVSEDGKIAVTCGKDNQFRIWDTSTFKDPIIRRGFRNEADQFAAGLSKGLKAVPATVSAVTSVDISPDNKWVAAGSSNGSISVVPTDDPDDNGRVLSGHNRRVNDVKFSPDGSKIASCSNDEIICIWDAETYECLLKLTGHTKSIRSIRWGEDSMTLVSAGGRDRTVRFWNLEHAERILYAALPEKSEGGSIFARAKNAAISAAKDMKNLVLNKDLSYHVILCDNDVSCIAVAPDNEHIAVGAGPKIHIFPFTDCDDDGEESPVAQTQEDHSTGAVSAMMNQYYFNNNSKTYTSLQFSDDSERLLSSSGNSIEWWEVYYEDFDDDWDWYMSDEDDDAMSDFSAEAASATESTMKQGAHLERLNTFMTIQKVSVAIAQPNFETFLAGDGTGAIYVLRPRDETFLERLKDKKAAAKAQQEKMAAANADGEKKADK